MKTTSLCASTFTVTICCLIALSCSPTATTRGRASFSEQDYLNATRQFAEAISARDYDGAWQLASQHLASKTDRAGFEQTCESFFARFGYPTGIRRVGVNATGSDLKLELEELSSTVPATAAKAWCIASFKADKDINVGVILVGDTGTLRIGEFWLYDD